MFFKSNHVKYGKTKGGHASLAEWCDERCYDDEAFHVGLGADKDDSTIMDFAHNELLGVFGTNKDYCKETLWTMLKMLANDEKKYT